MKPTTTTARARTAGIGRGAVAQSNGVPRHESPPAAHALDTLSTQLQDALDRAANVGSRLSSIADETLGPDDTGQAVSEAPARIGRVHQLDQLLAMLSGVLGHIEHQVDRLAAL